MVRRAVAAAHVLLCQLLQLALQLPRGGEASQQRVPTEFSRWRTQQYSLGAAMNVTAGGAFTLEVAGARVVVASSFTEAAAGGAHVRHLGDTLGGSWPGVSVDRSLSDDNVWVVRASCATYSLKRTYRWERARLEVHDTLTPVVAGSDSVVGIEVNHTASMVGGGQAAGAVLGGGLMPFDCANLPTLHNWGQLGHGNPSVYMDAGPVGVGLLARDDVFALHASTRQRALARYPRMPSALPSCPTTDPPSIELADPTFAMAANTTADGSYTMRWDAIFTGAECQGYYCFINRAREAVGATEMPLNGTGWMSLPPDWCQRRPPPACMHGHGLT